MPALSYVKLTVKEMPRTKSDEPRPQSILNYLYVDLSKEQQAFSRKFIIYQGVKADNQRKA